MTMINDRRIIATVVFVVVGGLDVVVVVISFSTKFQLIRHDYVRVHVNVLHVRSMSRNFEFKMDAIWTPKIVEKKGIIRSFHGQGVLATFDG